MADRTKEEEIKKPATEIKLSDTQRRGNIYKVYPSFHEALIAAGYQSKPWQRPQCPPGYWDKKSNRVDAIKFLVSNSNKPLSEIGWKDFRNFRLESLLVLYYNYNISNALEDAGYDMSKCIRRKRIRYWSVRENRIAAIKSLVEKLNKPPAALAVNDLYRNGIGAVLHYYGGSVTKALREAGYEFKMWERTRVPSGYWNKKTNRVNAVRWLVKTLGKPTNKIVREDFIKHKLSALLSHGKPITVLLREAGYKIPLWGKRRCIPRFWDDRVHREDAVRDLLIKLNKDPRTITYRDFINNGLGALLRYYNYSVTKLLMDLGYITSPLQQRYKPIGFWNNKENRRQAIRNVVEASNKPIFDINYKDFVKAGISNMVNRFYNKIYIALRDAGYDIQPWELKTTPVGFWDKKENRVNAIKWLISKANKPPSELKVEDFEKHNLMRLYVRYMPRTTKKYPRGEFFEYDEGYLLKYRSPITRALIEAGIIPHKA